MLIITRKYGIGWLNLQAAWLSMKTSMALVALIECQRPARQLWPSASMANRSVTCGGGIEKQSQPGENRNQSVSKCNVQ